MKQIKIYSRYVLAVLISFALFACSSAPKEQIPALRIEVQASHEKALQAIRLGDVESAVLLWQQTLTLYQALDDWPGQGMARLGLAQAQQRLGQIDVAKQTLAPVLDKTLFTDDVRARAYFQLAQLELAHDAGVAAMNLAASEQACAAPCALRWAQSNLAAKIAIARQDWLRAQTLSAAVLAGAPEGERAERAHAYRLSAQALLQLQQAAQAKNNIAAAIRLDRELARPDWLLDDYRVQAQIAEALADEGLAQETALRIQSLCQALRCD